MINNPMEKEKNLTKLLLYYAKPSIFSLLIAGLYGIIDGIFVGQKIGPKGLSAITLAYPITSFLIAIGVLIGVGAAVFISRNIASKNMAVAKSYLLKGLVLFVISSILLFTLSFFTSNIMYLLGKGTDADVVQMAETFVRVLLIGSPIYIAPIIFNDFLKNMGKPREAMISMLFGSITNIVLDFILIFVFDLRLLGAGIATVTGQFVAFLFMIYFSKTHPIWKIKKKITKPLIGYFQIIHTGFTSFIIQITTMLLLIIHNQLFLHYGNELYVSSFGVIGYGITIFWMVTMGFAGGAQPIISYTFGANKIERTNKITKRGYLFTVGFSILYMLMFFIFPTQIASLFTQDQTLIAMTTKAIYLMMYALPFAAYNIFTATYFQSIGHTKKAVFLTAGRVVLFMLPFAIVLPQLLGVDGIYLIIPLSEIGTFFISLSMRLYHLKHITRYFTLNK